jgi:membrane-associated phospholipid phosphatase
MNLKGGEFPRPFFARSSPATQIGSIIGIPEVSVPPFIRLLGLTMTNLATILKQNRAVRRLLMLAAIFAVQSLYLPTNRLLSGGVAPSLPLDAFIPLWPIWTPVYLVWIPFWVLVVTFSAWKMDDRLFKDMFISLMTAIVTAMLTYVSFPTYVLRPEVTGSGWAVEMLRGLYRTDDIYNALPSGHMYIITLIALYWTRWNRRTQPLMIALVTLIGLSTLFTKQHYVLDLAAGLLLAYAAYRLGVWWVYGRRAAQDTPIG